MFFIYVYGQLSAIKNLFYYYYYKQVRNNKNKCQSIKHVTSDKYIHALHWTIYVT